MADVSGPKYWAKFDEAVMNAMAETKGAPLVWEEFVDGFFSRYRDFISTYTDRNPPPNPGIHADDPPDKNG